MGLSITYSQLLIRLAIGSGINLLLATSAFKRHSVSRSGAVTGFMVGLVIYLGGGIWFWLHLGAFFISSTLLSRFKREVKAHSTARHEKDGRRDGIQVVANTGPGAAAALLFLIYPHFAVLAAFCAAFAAANADTWAGEIGMLSPRPPVSILSRKTLPTGASGGVTLLGLTASAAGAAFIAAISSGSLLLTLAVQNLPAAGPGIYLVPVVSAAVSLAMIATLSGLLGSLLDSILGASLQAEYLCCASGQHTERSHTGRRSNTLIKGYRQITNDSVNLLSVSAAAIAAFLLAVVLPLPAAASLFSWYA